MRRLARAGAVSERRWLKLSSRMSASGTRTGCTPFVPSISPSKTASFSSWSALRAAASRRRSAWSPGSRTSATAGCSIGGTVANDLSPRDRNIAMVFQSYALYPHLTVAENIGFGLRVRGVASEEIAAKVKETAAILELRNYLQRKPAQLSGGQRQRVAMGRAIVREPHAFLMDEPLVEPRRAAARADARRDRPHPEDDRRHHHLCHPRPGRGHDHGRPGRGDEPWRAAAAGDAAHALPSNRPTCSWRASSARRRSTCSRAGSSPARAASIVLGAERMRLPATLVAETPTSSAISTEW